MVCLLYSTPLYFTYQEAMNIAYILHRTTSLGGGTKSFMQMLGGLTQKGIQPYVIMPASDGICQDINQMGVRFLSGTITNFVCINYSKKWLFNSIVLAIVSICTLAMTGSMTSLTSYLLFMHYADDGGISLLLHLLSSCTYLLLSRVICYMD